MEMLDDNQSLPEPEARPPSTEERNAASLERLAASFEALAMIAAWWATSQGRE